jgi:hypothetical protein
LQTAALILYLTAMISLQQSLASTAAMAAQPAALRSGVAHQQQMLLRAMLQHHWPQRVHQLA